jgi:hypothetical protein
MDGYRCMDGWISMDGYRWMENLMIFEGFSWFLGNVKISWFLNTLTVFHDFQTMWKSDDFWRFFVISGQCENLMIFNHFDGFSWFPDNVKIWWFLNTFDGFSWFLGKKTWFLNTLKVFRDFWAMWKSHDFWRFFVISGQCENLMIFKHFDGFSWFPDNVKIWWFLNTFDSFSWFLGNVKISWFSNFLTVYHDFWTMWKSHGFQTFWRFFMISDF